MAELELFNQVAAQIAAVLGCNAGEISAATSADDIPNWDSLSNVKLLIQLERAFKIRFTGVDATSLENVGELVDLITVKLAK